MKVYVLMVCDRHFDPTPFVFTSAEAAVDAAKEFLTPEELAGTAPDLGERPHGEFLYYVPWSAEGDSLWVIEREADGPVELP